MEVFVLILFVPVITCDDDSTYVENLKGVYGTFEEAKIEADKMICDNDDIVSCNSFVRIIKMTVGDKKKEIVFQSIHSDKLGWGVFNE